MSWGKADHEKAAGMSDACTCDEELPAKSSLCEKMPGHGASATESGVTIDSVKVDVEKERTPPRLKATIAAAPIRNAHQTSLNITPLMGVAKGVRFSHGL